MDEIKRKHYADQCRNSSDEELISLLRHADSLIDELKQGMLDALAERPNADELRARARDWISRPSRSDSERPGLGFWLGLLVFGLCTAPVRIGYFATKTFELAERMRPTLVHMRPWQLYKILSGALWIGVLFAAIVGVFAIVKGTNRRHLHRALASIWFISCGTMLCDLLLAGLLFGPGMAGSALHLYQIPLGIGMSLAFLWTLYLTRSERCRRRYPKSGAELRTAQVFD